MKPIRIELPLNISYASVNAYFFPGPVPTLVDCGLNTPEVIRKMEKALKSHGCSLAEIQKVVITHPHVDHIGLAGIFAKNGAEIWLTDLAADWMTNLDVYRSEALNLLLSIMSRHGFDEASIQMTDEFYRGLSPMFTEIPESSRRIFKAGQAIEFGGLAYEVIAAPGHSNRQVCFYQAKARRLFSADMLLPRTPVPVIETRLDGSGLRDIGLQAMLGSYASFLALQVDEVFPGHGRPFDDPQALIKSQVARINRRKAECLALIKDGVDSLPKLLSKMYRKLPARARLGGLAMLVGYLDLLLEDKKIHPIEAGGHKIYRLSE